MKDRTAQHHQNELLGTEEAPQLPTVERFRVHGLASTQSLHYVEVDNGDLELALMRGKFDDYAQPGTGRVSESHVLVRLNIDGEGLAVVYTDWALDEGSALGAAQHALAVLTDTVAHLERLSGTGDHL